MKIHMKRRLHDGDWCYLSSSCLKCQSPHQIPIFLSFIAYDLGIMEIYYPQDFAGGKFSKKKYLSFEWGLVFLVYLIGVHVLVGPLL